MRRSSLVLPSYLSRIISSIFLPDKFTITRIALRE